MTTVFTSCGKLASAGDDIKIWELPSFGISNQFAPQSSTSFRSLHWSPDSHQLVVVPSNGEKLFLTLVRSAAVHSIEVITGVTNSCAKFSSSSPRYLGIGTTSGKVFMWDLKIQKPKKSFVGSSEVTCIQFNQKDTCIASGSISGSISLHSLITGQSFSSLKTSQMQSIRDLKYNNFRISVLGSASDDGAICLWDTNSHTLLHQYAASHNAPATSLVFSPINDSFLISVGLDKKIKCYDTHMKSCVNCLSSDAPFTAVDFMEDGATLAVGSTRGKIYLYDLRSSRTPLKIIEAHSVSVQSLAFQKVHVESSKKEISQMKTQSIASNNLLQPTKIGKILSDSGRSCKSSDILNSAEVYTSETNKLKRISNGSTTRASFNSKDSLSEAFSPLKDKDSSADDPLIRKSLNVCSLEAYPSSTPYEHGTVETEKMLISSIQSIRSVEALSMNEDDHNDNSQIFSPKIIIPVEPVYDYHKDSPLTDSTHTPLPSILQEQHLEILTTANSSTPREPNKNSSNSSFPPTLNSSVSDTNLLGESITSICREPFIGSSFIDKQISEQATDEEMTKNNLTSRCSITGIKATEENHALEKNPLPPFQVEFIRKIVQDAMEEFTDTLRNDLLNLHVQMVRQFQTQMAEMQSLIQRFSLNEELVREIERLEEENRQLRTTF